MSYSLNGEFVECCDCFTVCPCWVNNVPDEGHCSGLYVWSFGPGSRIGAVDVEGMHVAAATFHAIRADGQVIFFIDVGNLLGSEAVNCEHLLYTTFSGKSGGTAFSGLVKLLGINHGYHAAQILSTFANGNFHITVNVGNQIIATAGGQDKIFDGNGSAMTLQQTALNQTLGIGGNNVVVQEMGVLKVDVAALPGGALNFRGRSGMRTKFMYEHRDLPASARTIGKADS